MTTAGDTLPVGNEGLERLQQLLEHLEFGRLTVREFRMDAWREVRAGSVVGCSAGECVRLWPMYWHFARTLMTPGWKPVLRGSEMGGTIVSLAMFFGLNFDEACMLFTLGRGIEPGRLWGGQGMSTETTRDQAAANLRKYVKWRRDKARAWALSAAGGAWRDARDRNGGIRNEPVLEGRIQ